MEKQKLIFLSRMKIAIMKLEDYVVFLQEKISVSFKYFLTLVFLVSFLFSIIQTYDMSKAINRGYNYIKNQLPDFIYKDGKLEFTQNVEAYDKDMDFYLFIDTTEVMSDNILEEYKKNIKSYGIIFLSDKIIFVSDNSDVEYGYKELANQYQIETLNKQDLIGKIDSLGMVGLITTIFIVILVSIFIVKFISIFMDWFILSIFGYCAVKICKINISYKQIFNISIYALTLSILLNFIYDIINYLTGFYMPYFRIMYLLISYVYVVAVIFMIKSDFVKQQRELTKVAEVQKQVHEELEEEKNKPQDDNKDDDSNKNEEDNSIDDETSGEPDGSGI